MGLSLVHDLGVNDSISDVDQLVHWLNEFVTSIQNVSSPSGKEINVELKPGASVWIFTPDKKDGQVTCVYKMEPPDKAISVSGKRVTVTLKENGFTPPSVNTTDPIVLTPSQSRGFATKYIRMEKSKEYTYSLERLF